MEVGRVQGDWDGNGYGDIAVGAPHAFAFTSNSAPRQLFGSFGAQNPSPFFLISSRPAEVSTSPAYYAFPWALANVDLDANGFSDLVVATYEPFSSVGSQLVIYEGHADGLRAARYVTLTEVRTGHGAEIWPAGDVNADGYPDLVVLAKNAEDSGSAYVYFGGPQGITSSSPVQELLNGDPRAQAGDLAFSGGSAGDVDADGYSDVVFVHMTRNPDVRSHGIVVFYGSEAGLVERGLETRIAMPAPDGTSGFGTSVDGAGDVDGDGYSDVVAGSYGDAAFLFRGGADGLVAERMARLARVGGTWQGRAAAAGDVNGDGYGDVCIPLGNGTLLYGASDGLNVDQASRSVALRRTSGSTVGAGRCTAVGDLNGDGFGDVIWSLPYQSAASEREGEITVFYGAIGGVDPASGSIAVAVDHPNNVTDGNFGTSVAGIAH